MKIQILQFAKTKNLNFAELEAEYEKRLQPFAKLESISLQASKSDEKKRVQNDERDSLIAKLDKDSTIVALDEHGIEFTTEEFAEFLRKERDFGPGKIQFLIGGSHGLHPDILKSAKKIISLSKMTFTHEMVRVFLKEQIYCAFTILAGKKYHK